MKDQQKSVKKYHKPENVLRKIKTGIKLIGGDHADVIDPVEKKMKKRNKISHYKAY